MFRRSGLDMFPIPERYTVDSLAERLTDLDPVGLTDWRAAIQTIQDRGYVFRRVGELIPTWLGMDNVERYHAPPVPGIANLPTGIGDLRRFFIGLDGQNRAIVVRPGPRGWSVTCGPLSAPLPWHDPPDELDVDRALQLLEWSVDPIVLGRLAGVVVFLRIGSNGPYVEWGTSDRPPPGRSSPTIVPLFSTMEFDQVRLADAERLLRLPRVIGHHPDDGEQIVATHGPFGPWLRKGRDGRRLEHEEDLLDISLDEAVELFRRPKPSRRPPR